eukprot:jgi/Tetstr1/438259/TSEL_026828.t1
MAARAATTSGGASTHQPINPPTHRLDGRARRLPSSGLGIAGHSSASIPSRGIVHGWRLGSLGPARATTAADEEQYDVMGVGEDPVGEDGMDIDASAWPPAGVEAADEGVIREGDPGDFYMKVIAKKFRGVWHYGVITGVVTEWV